MNIRPIRTDADHLAALKEIERLWNAPEGSDDHDKLDILATLVEKYEESRWPVEQGYQQLKEELGIDHFEGRSWTGFHHHICMAFLAYGFLELERRRLRRQQRKMSQKKPCENSDASISQARLAGDPHLVDAGPAHEETPTTHA